jgi:RAD50-interacting protein 1
VCFLTIVANGSEKARREISTDPHEALKTYTQLRDLSNELNSRNEKAWGSMIHLTEYVEASTKQLWEEMEQTLSVYVLSQYY